MSDGPGTCSENKVKTVNGVSDVFRYDGDGNRIRKNFTSGENVRMIYSRSQLIAEYDLTNGSLKKEYIYGAKGLIATIEPANGIRYITSDHLGSPRLVTDSNAGVVSRHDYMPFGEELCSGVGGRTTGMGFCVSDGLRQKFTSKERDVETGLDFFLARYYTATQGRFATPDEFTGGPTELYFFASDTATNPTFYADLTEPQSLNKYQYAYNNPQRYIDPDGHKIQYLEGQTKDDREEVKARLLWNVAKKEQKYFTVKYDEKTKKYMLGLRGNVDKALSKPHTVAFEAMVRTIRTPGTVRVGIDESFQYKDKSGDVQTASTAKGGGGTTVSQYASMSGDVEVHLSRSSFIPTVPGLSGHPVKVLRSLVAGHEVLGHAMGLLILGHSTETDAVLFENQIRRGRGLPLRDLPGVP